MKNLFKKQSEPAKPVSDNIFEIEESVVEAKPQEPAPVVEAAPVIVQEERISAKFEEEVKVDSAKEQINTMDRLTQAAMVAEMEGIQNIEISPMLFEYLAAKSNRKGQPKTESITFMGVRLFKEGEMDRLLNLEEGSLDNWGKYHLQKQAVIDQENKNMKKEAK